MAAHSTGTGQETTDEDAAVLQFPKGIFKIKCVQNNSCFCPLFRDGVVYYFYTPKTTLYTQSLPAVDFGFVFAYYCFEKFSEVNQQKYQQCFACSILLTTQTYIVCDECPSSVCLACFAKGREGNGIHSSNHRYRIFRDDITIFEDWTVRDELSLLDILTELGPSNWLEVSRRLKVSGSDTSSPSATECERHYTHSYLEYPHAALPRPHSPEQLYRPLPMPYKWGTHEPPRPIPGSTYHRDMAGYCPARGDFHTEVFNNAELDVSSIDFDSLNKEDEEEQEEEEIRRGEDVIDKEEEAELMEALSFGVVQVYNDKLKERCRRKRIIQEHGLINMRRHMATRYRYDAALTHRVCERLSPIAQLFKFQDYWKFMEGLHAHAELKQRIRQLQKYRHLGITTMAGVELHTQLQLERDKRQKQLKQFAANLHSAFPHMQQPVLMAAVVDPSSGITTPLVVNQRRSAPPLDIVGLPGYDNLNEGERQLCSVSRLVPASYIEFRNILIAECRQRHGIRLAQARTLIKIDVNKTRKIFDYLLEEKLIHLPLSTSWWFELFSFLCSSVK